MATRPREPRFRFRALTPDQELAVKDAIGRGVQAAELAAEYGVTRRTIWRTVERADRARYEVRVADQRATFEIEDGTPVQVTPWVPV